MLLHKNLYRKFIDIALPLADQLAAVRSILANERTFLSYQRTALTFIVAGFSFIKFFHTFWMTVIGWLFLPIGLITFILGTYRYYRMREVIKNLEDESNKKK